MPNEIKSALSAPTEHGATVELHRDHYDPLLEIVRAAKSEAVRRKDFVRGNMLREIEYRLSGASRAAGNTTC